MGNSFTMDPASAAGSGESSLSIAWTEWREEVGRFLNFGRTIANWTADQTVEVDRFIERGIRQFLNPPPVETDRGSKVKHEWSFLRPVTTLTVNAPYSTGTVTVASGVVTLASGTFPSWAADGTFVVSGVQYSVSTRDSDTQITLDDTSVTAAAGSVYQLVNWDYDLPATFGGPSGPMTFAGGSGYCEARRVGEADIRVRRQNMMTAITGPPHHYAVRPKDMATGTVGQRFELLVWPAPDKAYVLTYRYLYLIGEITSGSPFPPGGMMHAETILQSCLAIAERRIEHRGTKEFAAFMQLLKGSIEHDRRISAPDTYGYNGDSSEASCFTHRTRRVTYQPD